MKQNFKCPYCNQNSYAATSKFTGYFPDWKAVSRHTSRCDKNTGEYTFNEVYGPLHWSEFAKDKYYITYTYPKLIKISNILRTFRYKGYKVTNMHKISDNTILFDYLILWIEENKTIPSVFDWKYNTKYPNITRITAKFGSWNNFIKAAGYNPNIQNGFGINTKGLDGHLYRSRAEAYFCDNYLFNKVEYVIEPKYPEPYNKWYDWYLPESDTYIELDGGLRPKVITEKIEINKQLNRKLLVIAIEDIYKNTDSTWDMSLP